MILNIGGSYFTCSHVGCRAYLAIDRVPSSRISGSDSHSRTTSSLMERTAVLRGLEARTEPSRVTIVTDSRYVSGGLERILALDANDWRQLRRLRNPRLWRRVFDALGRHTVTYRWIRGHAGEEGNAIVDRLAREAAENHATTT